MIKIRRWDNEKVIHSGNFEDVKSCLEDGVRKGISFYKANLIREDLTCVSLVGADLSGSLLFKADLTETDLTKSDLADADLERANLTRVDLREASLSGAELGRTNLTETTLDGAYLSHANIRGANLSKVCLTRVNLTGVKGILVFKAVISGRLYYFIDGEEIKVQAGCFWGTIPELKERIKNEHSEETHWDYLASCDIAERAFRGHI